VACPYEGPIAPNAVRDVAARLLDLGVDEIDLGETIGVAVPTDVDRLYDALDGLLTPERTTLHLHDTRGTALACAYRALQRGVCSFDASCGGLGGCPYAPGAAGNLATEDLVYLCERMGVHTGVRLDQLVEAGREIAAALGRTLPGRVLGAVTGSS
ncbi:MAG: hydroxymethylglutaryl-CoA lyase, partial [Phycisphaerales bacterium]|nr:hydroxymethylglutaryl-CoA lyase [Phycisphaerales bacterium]